jgi:hypothetical protein
MKVPINISRKKNDEAKDIEERKWRNIEKKA